MSVPITTQPQPESNTENPNIESTDAFSNESKEHEVLQPIENEVALDGEVKKKKNEGWFACCFSCNDTDDVDTVFDFCECLAWFSSTVTDCIQCGCIECCQCLGNCCTGFGDCCTEFGTECGDCFSECGNCDCDCDCDCSD